MVRRAKLPALSTPVGTKYAHRSGICLNPRYPEGVYQKHETCQEESQRLFENLKKRGIRFLTVLHKSPAPSNIGALSWGKIRESGKKCGKPTNPENMCGTVRNADTPLLKIKCLKIRDWTISDFWALRNPMFSGKTTTTFTRWRKPLALQCPIF